MEKLTTKVSDEEQTPAFLVGAVIGSATEKPTMEKYGYHGKCGFEDDESGWMFEGGEDAYYEALKKWEDAQ